LYCKNIIIQCNFNLTFLGLMFSLKFNFIDTKRVPVLSFLHLRSSSVQCSNPLPHKKKTLYGSFPEYSIHSQQLPSCLIHIYTTEFTWQQIQLFILTHSISMQQHCNWHPNILRSATDYSMLSKRFHTYEKKLFESCCSERNENISRNILS
jgi:hypothetical protein